MIGNIHSSACTPTTYHRQIDKIEMRTRRSHGVFCMFCDVMATIQTHIWGKQIRCVKIQRRFNALCQRQQETKERTNIIFCIHSSSSCIVLPMMLLTCIS